MIPEKRTYNRKAMSKDALQLLKRGVEEIIPEKNFLEQINSKKTLRIKAGFDPTSPDLHLGHTVLLNKMKLFQDLGHEVIFLIGDFTGLVGDPSGVNETRPVLSKEQLDKNAQTYKEQVFKILDPSKTEVRYNSEWMQNVDPSEFIKMLSSYTVARMLERDDFSKRYKAQQPISIHEFLYPILQGREVQKHYGKDQQSILTVPLLEGLDGVKKMSKSLGNYIALDDSPDEMFGKLMSISDKLMWRYFSLLSFKPMDVIEGYKLSIDGGTNPRDIKFLLAEEIVERFHPNSGEKSKENFINRFQKGKISQDLKEIFIDITSDEELLTRIMKESDLLESTSEAIRMIKQGAVRVNDEKVSDTKFCLQKGTKYLVQVGKKRAANITLN